MTALRDQLVILAPEFVTADAPTIARQEQFIVWAALQVNRNVFKTKADLATIMLAAHMLTKFPSDGSSTEKGVGPVTSDKVGELQINYGAVGAEVRADLATTVYGVQFWSLMKQVPKTPLCL